MSIDPSLTLLGVFTASLLGSLHCVGMCGGFVALATGHERPFLASSLAYHLSRLIAYGMLGAAAGGIGAGVAQATSLIGLQGFATVVFSLFLIISGLLVILPERFTPLRFRFLRGFQQRLVTIGKSAPGIRAPAAFGFLSALLPCGWLYMFVLVAAASGNALQGMLIMSAFWVGTVPALVGVSLGVRVVSRTFAQYLPRAVALLLIGFGCFSLYSHLSPHHEHTHFHHAH